MKNLNWDRLQLFLAVARTHSFNEAAKNSPVDQSTISRHMQRLEEELGLVLFSRTTRGVFVTPAGQAIVELALDIEAKVKLIEARAAEEMGLSGKVRLWVSEGIGGYWLPPRMKEFHRRYPNIMTEVLCSVDAAAIGGRGVDVAVTWHKPEHPEAVILSENVMTLKPCASEEYLHNFGTPRNMDDLQHHRLCDHLLYPKVDDWERWATIIEKCPSVSYTTNSSWALGEATVSGVGISLQPIGVQSRESNLKILDIEGYQTQLRFWLTCHKKIKDIPRVRALINYIKSELFRDAAAGAPFSPAK